MIHKLEMPYALLVGAVVGGEIGVEVLAFHPAPWFDVPEERVSDEASDEARATHL